MGKTALSDSLVRTLRITCVIVGSIGLLVALLAKHIGLSIGQGISLNQLAIGMLGLVLILAGLTGRRFPGLYRGFALILLNVVILVMLVDLVSLVLLKVWRPEELSRSERRAQTDTVHDEARMNWGSYAPFIVWKADTSLFFEEEVGPDGFRITPGSVPSEDSYKVFVLGGSTVWGVGAPDSSTIPARLLNELESKIGRPLEVRNMGQYGWVSTQEMLELLFHIRSGDIPDLVIFLDGMNDVAAAYQSGIAGTHQNYPSIEARMEQRSGPDDAGPSPLMELLRRSNSYILLSQIAAGSGLEPMRDETIINYETFGRTVEDLSPEIVDVMLGNYAIVRGLADQWGFEAAFFIQPSVWTGSKAMTRAELTLMNGASGNEGFAVGADPAWEPLLLSSYDLLEVSAESIPDLFSLVEVFDGVDSTVYTDFTGVHIIPEANRTIAEEMVDLLYPVVGDPPLDIEFPGDSGDTQ